MTRTKRWLRSAVLAAAVVAAAPRALFAQTPPPIENAAAAAQKELNQLEAVLSDSGASMADRDRAAKKLVSRSRPEADEILRRIVQTPGNREGQIAVARALASAASPNPAFIDPLANLLGDKELTGPAAQALAAHKNSDKVRLILLKFAGRRNQSVSVRADAIRAMGRLVDRPTAGSLIELLNGEDNPLIRNAATDALGEMTGQTQYGTDAQQWNRWWQINQNKTDLQWSTDLLNKNATRAFELEKRLRQVREQTLKLIRDEYKRTPDDDRAKKLIAYLQSESEDVRWAGLQIVYEQVVDSKPMSATVFQLLRGMVGDSSTEVRAQVARTLATINDRDAVEALLVQLSQEKEAEVRAAIVQALKPIQDVRIIPPLMARLDDESFSVARSAAEALREQADTLRKKENEALALSVSQKLLARLPTTDGNLSLMPLRQSIIEAMARLAHPSFMGTFYALVNSEKESINVRRAAISGLGLLGNPDAANVIASALNDPSPVVRLAAVGALKTTATWNYANTLGERLSPTIEPDPDVRDRAWEVLTALLEKAPERDLGLWAERFNKRDSELDANRRLTVLLVLEQKLQASNQDDRLATARQNIGGTLLDLARVDDAAGKIERATEKAAGAAAKLRQALDYWTTIKAGPSTTDYLMQQLLKALLRSRKDIDAIQFAAQAIQQNPANAETIVWPKVKEEIETRSKAGDFDAALLLIDSIRKLALPAVYNSQLPLMESDIKEQKKKQATSGGRTWVHQNQPKQLADLFPFLST